MRTIVIINNKCFITKVNFKIQGQGVTDLWLRPCSQHIFHEVIS